MYINKSVFGKYQDEDLHLFTMGNGKEEVSIINFGAIIISIKVPDQKAVVEKCSIGLSIIR